MKKNCFLLFICFALVSVAYGQKDNIEKLSQKFNIDKSWGNDSIGIFLDTILRTDVYPTVLIGPGSIEARFPSDRNSKSQEDNWDFVVIHFTISLIEKTHMVGFGGLGEEQSILFDAKGNKSELVEWCIKGFNISDPTDLRSPMEIIVGAKGYLVFNIPKAEKAAMLKFIYYFKESLNDKSRNKGQIDINILENQK